MSIINALNKINNKQKGMTLLEVVVTLALVGVLAALSLPNLFSMLAKTDVSQGVNTMKFTLQNTQRQTIRKNQGCKIQLVSDNIIRDVTVYDTGSIKDCFSNAETENVTVSGNTMRQLKLPTGVKITTNLSSSTIEFSFQGMIVGNLTSTANQPATIVFSKAGTQDKSCLVISPIIGLVRNGKYTGNNTSSGIVLQDTNPENLCNTNL